MKSSEGRSATRSRSAGCRRLVLVFGDQLDENLAAFEDFDPSVDRVWMAEVDHEATYVWSHQARLVFFFSAMRHHRDSLVARGWTVEYHELQKDPKSDRGKSFGEVLLQDLNRLRPEEVRFCETGDYRVESEITATLAQAGVASRKFVDRHYLCTVEAFRDWAGARKSLVLEHFYRWMRKRTGILLDEQGEPLGGRWNFDDENRETFGKAGPPKLPKAFRVEPDRITREVIEMVSARFAKHPGDATTFDQPVDRAGALKALDDFVTRRLPFFGQYQDAMWDGEAFLFHSRLSPVLNVHLLDPREVISAALQAQRRHDLPLASVEGFVRQVLGWREFVRGIYWTRMPDYAQLNSLECEDVDVPKSFWDGETRMACISSVMKSVRRNAYAHHIERLMVLGLFAQLAGVHPYRFHEWHLAMYADAIDWVSLPNTLGMSQYGDGGLVGTKPYCASGAYIRRMSNHCASCPFDPQQATGPKACPFTTLYWDFLARHDERFRGNLRMKFQMVNLDRKSPTELAQIQKQAKGLRERLARGEDV